MATAKIPFRTAYDRSYRTPQDFSGNSMTKQSFKNECDINGIMAKFEKTGIIEHARNYQGDYTDCINISDYHTAHNQILAAQDAFASLPASIRKKFENDPYAFISFAQDPANHQEMVDLGLAYAKREDSSSTPEDKNSPPPPAENTPLEEA